MRRTGLILCGMALSWAVFAQSPMREGRWEISMQMDMPNMPMKMPPMTTTQCITKEQLQDPMKAVPQGPGTPSDCKMSDYKIDGSKVTWTMACTGKDKVSGSGEIVYSGDTYNGVIRLSTAQGDMSMKTSGKRLGDCTP